MSFNILILGNVNIREHKVIRIMKIAEINIEGCKRVPAWCVHRVIQLYIEGILPRPQLLISMQVAQWCLKHLEEHSTSAFLLIWAPKFDAQMQKY